MLLNFKMLNILYFHPVHCCSVVGMGPTKKRDCRIHRMPIVAQMSEVLFFMLTIWKCSMLLGICIVDKVYYSFTCQYSTLTYKPRSKCQFFTLAFLIFLFAFSL